MYLDNIKIKDMDIILNKNTTLSRFYPLIPLKNTIIERLLKSGTLLKSQYDEIYDSDIDEIRRITGMSEGVDECFHSALHLHDFKNRSISEFKSISPDIISAVRANGYKKTLDIINLASEKSINEMAELLNISTADTQRLCAMCHLMRLPGVKDTRASLYYDSGLRSLDDFASSTTDKILVKVSDYIAKSKCGKSVPQRKEIETQIAVSRVLSAL